MSNIIFYPSTVNHLELWFSTKYTLQEITEIVNKHILSNDYNITDTQVPKYYVKIHLCKDPSVLWN